MSDLQTKYSAIQMEASGQTFVYAINENGNLLEFNTNNFQNDNKAKGQQVMELNAQAGTAIAAIEGNQGNGTLSRRIYYVTRNGRIADATVNSNTGWVPGTLERMGFGVLPGTGILYAVAAAGYFRVGFHADGDGRLIEAQVPATHDGPVATQWQLKSPISG